MWCPKGYQCERARGKLVVREQVIIMLELLELNLSTPSLGCFLVVHQASPLELETVTENNTKQICGIFVCDPSHQSPRQPGISSPDCFHQSRPWAASSRLSLLGCLSTISDIIRRGNTFERNADIPHYSTTARNRNQHF